MDDLVYLSKAQIVTDRVRAMIASGEFEQGRVLRQREMTELLGVSATPVREAFQRLAVEGYLLLEDHRGARVVPMAGRLKESFMIFGALQGLTARVACERLRSGDVAVLEQTLEVYRQAASSGAGNDELYALSRRFSDQLTQLAALPMVAHMLKVRWDAHTPYHHELSSAQGIQMSSHRIEWMEGIIRAIRSKDPDYGEVVTRTFAERLYALSTRLGGVPSGVDGSP